MATLLLDVAGQELVHTPPMPITAATWVLEDLGVKIGETGRVLDSGAATVNLTAFTTDDPAGWEQESSTKVPVGSTASATKGLAWIEDAGGAGEQIKIHAIVVDDFLRLERGLTSNYATGSTIRMLGISATILDAVTADEDLLEAQLRVVWTYVLDGRTIKAQDRATLARHAQGDGELSEAKDFANDYFPELQGQLRDQGNELDGWARMAKLLVSNDMREVGIEPAKMLAGPRARELLGFKLLIISAHNGIKPANGDAKVWLAGLKFAYDQVWEFLTIGSVGADATELDRNDQSTVNPERARFDFSM